MDIKKAKDVMIPLSEYATVNEEDTLEKAIKTLYHSQKILSCDEYKHRAVLVFDDTGNIIGKVSPLDESAPWMFYVR